MYILIPIQFTDLELDVEFQIKQLFLMLQSILCTYKNKLI